MTDDVDSEGGDDASNATDTADAALIEMETVETRLKTADDQLQALLEATDDVDAPGPLRRRLAETRRELLLIGHEFNAHCADSNNEHSGHEAPPITSRGGTVDTIVGP